MITVGDIAEVKGGKRLPKGKLVQKERTPHPYIRVTDFTRDGVNERQVRYIDSEAYSKIARYTISDQDVYISIAGTIGLVGMVPASLNGANLTENAAKICNINKAYIPKYIVYYLKSDQGIHEIKSRVVGTSQPKLALFRIKEIPLPEVPIKTQERIADILGSYDDLITNNMQRVEKLELMARSLYLHYFNEAAASDWNHASLDECLTVHRGRAYKSSELSELDGLPFINLKCVNRNGGFRKDGLKRYTGIFKPSHEVVKGDLVMAVTDMTQERMIVARAARVPSLEGGHGVISMDLVKIEPKEGYSKDYLYSMLRWSRFADEVKNHANGANVLHLSPARITDYKMTIPPKLLRDEFTDKVRPLLDLIDVLIQKNESLAKARDLLLPRLMSGEIEV